VPGVVTALITVLITLFVPWRKLNKGHYHSFYSPLRLFVAESCWTVSESLLSRIKINTQNLNIQMKLNTFIILAFLCNTAWSADSKQFIHIAEVAKEKNQTPV